MAPTRFTSGALITRNNFDALDGGFPRPAPPSPQGGVLVSSYGPVATLSIFCADQALAPEFQPRRRGHSPLLTTPKTSSPALRAGLFLLRNSQSVILGSSDTAKDLLPIYVSSTSAPVVPSGAFSFAKSHARPPLCCKPVRPPLRHSQKAGGPVLARFDTPVARPLPRCYLGGV